MISYIMHKYFFILSFVIQITSTISLSSHDHNVCNKIERVAIIGAGIAGLTLAHALENSPFCASSLDEPLRGSHSTSLSCNYGIETHIFDSRSSLGAGGAGLQLTGGMAVLKKINPKLQQAVAKASLPLKRIKSVTKPWLNTGSTFWPLFEMDIKECIEEAGGQTERQLIVDNEVMSYTIMRSTLQDVLYQNLPETCKQRVQKQKKLVGLKSAPDGSGIICLFEDGTESGPFDLVIGCDGIKSVVKEYVSSGNISTSSSGEKSNQRAQSIYSGIKIQYAVQDGSSSESSSADSAKNAEMCQYFGDGVYALSALYGSGENMPPTNVAFLIFKDEHYRGPIPGNTNTPSVRENVEWNQYDEPLKDMMIRRVKQAHVPDDKIVPLIRDSNTFFELGVYFHNPLSLSGWSREVKASGGRYCVLCGDAAHAMPPFLGQGGNQAIQDAYVLASKIFQFNNRHLTVGNRPLHVMLKDYESLRWKPTASITAKSIFLGYLETGGNGFPSIFRDAFFFSAGKLGIAKKVYLDAATPQVLSEEIDR